VKPWATAPPRRNFKTSSGYADCVPILHFARLVSGDSLSALTIAGRKLAATCENADLLQRLHYLGTAHLLNRGDRLGKILIGNITNSHAFRALFGGTDSSSGLDHPRVSDRPSGRSSRGSENANDRRWVSYCDLNMRFFPDRSALICRISFDKRATHGVKVDSPFPF